MRIYQVKIGVIFIALLSLLASFSAFPLSLNATPGSAPNLANSANVTCFNDSGIHFQNSGLIRSITAASEVNKIHAMTYASGSVPKYNVTLTETGLPSGTEWVAILNGTMINCFGNLVVFKEPNGSYSFSTQALNYSASIRSGTLTVYGHPVNISITFTKGVTYGYFVGSVKPSNALIEIYYYSGWVTYKETNGKFNISLSPGTYRVGTVAPGYVTYSSIITVNSSEVTHFKQTSMTPLNPIPAALIAAVTITIAAVITLFVVFGRAFKKKK